MVGAKRAANGLWNVSKVRTTTEANVQSPSETTRAAKNPDSAKRREGRRRRGHPWFPLMCQRGHFCQPNCSEAFLVALVKWCNCLLEWIRLHCWLQSRGFPFSHVTQDPERCSALLWHLPFQSFQLQSAMLSVANSRLGDIDRAAWNITVSARQVDLPAWNLRAIAPSQLRDLVSQFAWLVLIWTWCSFEEYLII